MSYLLWGGQITLTGYTKSDNARVVENPQKLLELFYRNVLNANRSTLASPPIIYLRGNSLTYSGWRGVVEKVSGLPLEEVGVNFEHHSIDLRVLQGE